MQKYIDTLQRYDRRLVELAKGLHVLTRLSWQPLVQQAFMSAYDGGRRDLPQVVYETDSQTERIAGLRDIVKGVDTGHPLGRYLCDTAQSYISLCRLLEGAGSPRMTPYSLELYGRPGDPVASGRVTNLDAARHFLKVAARYDQRERLAPGDYCLPAATIRDELTTRMGAVFPRDKVRVVIAPELVSKAAAGATRIRLRDATCFSEFDIEQLLQHEAFVHTLTALNGREQPLFQSFGLGSPRTTATQEGLATFAELVTGAIDLGRLERIALRIVAIDMALNGADFIEVFEFFAASGQTQNESFYSAMRVFRGAPLTGGSAFTKDTVYLHGLLEVHTFFRWCLEHNNLDLARSLFAGRMTIADVVRLRSCFESESLAGPAYTPPWMDHGTTLAAHLAFSVFANQIRIDELGAGYEFDPNAP